MAAAASRHVVPAVAEHASAHRAAMDVQVMPSLVVAVAIWARVTAVVSHRAVAAVLMAAAHAAAALTAAAVHVAAALTAAAAHVAAATAAAARTAAVAVLTAVAHRAAAIPVAVAAEVMADRRAVEDIVVESILSLHTHLH